MRLQAASHQIDEHEIREDREGSIENLSRITEIEMAICAFSGFKVA